MRKEQEVVGVHPEGELQVSGNLPPEADASLDTFAGKVHVKWVPEAAVSGLGLMVFFIEFLKTSGLFDKFLAARISCGPHTARFRSGITGGSGRLAASCHLTRQPGGLRCRPGVRPMSPLPPPAHSSVSGKRCNC